MALGFRALREVRDVDLAVWRRFLQTLRRPCGRGE